MTVVCSSIVRISVGLPFFPLEIGDCAKIRAGVAPLLPPRPVLVFIRSPTTLFEGWGWVDRGHKALSSLILKPIQSKM